MGTMKAYWTNFIRTSNPIWNGFPRWEQNPDGLHYQELNETVGPMTKTKRKTGLFRIVESLGW